MSPSKSPDKLIYMANQIGKFFRAQGEEAAIKGTSEHLRKFWDPRMREAILLYVDQGGQGLDPIARLAVEQLRSSQAKI
jgi:formate dehydrogenase subunit delta